MVAQRKILRNIAWDINLIGHDTIGQKATTQRFSKGIKATAQGNYFPMAKLQGYLGTFVPIAFQKTVQL